MEAGWGRYSIGLQFGASLVSKRLAKSRILNVSSLLPLVGGIISRHRRIVSQANVKGPFYIKARIENVLRAIPFVDLSEYMTHVEKFDLPVVQASDLMVPTGTSLDTFVISPELESVPAESAEARPDGGAIAMWVEIMQALGIPRELLAENAELLLRVATRESDMHRARSPNG